MIFKVGDRVRILESHINNWFRGREGSVIEVTDVKRGRFRYKLYDVKCGNGERQITVCIDNWLKLKA